MNKIKKAKITVFTPAYNRAHTLPRTYQSLVEQDCKDFIWLVIDDGSVDDTADLVHNWIENEKNFEIRYIYKKNGGMHTAHNTAYANIDTELNICIDSDDKLAPGAISAILRKWDSVKGFCYAGLVGLDADFDGNIIGQKFPDNLRETTLTGYYAKGGSGDKKLVYRTDVINQYPPYPVFEGERYFSLAYKYRLIDQDYKLAVINDVLCNVEYQPDGSTNTMFRQYVNNPKGWAYWRIVCMQYPESTKRLIANCIHYVSSSVMAKNKHFVRESPHKALTFFMIPIGVLLSLYVQRKAK